MTKAERELRSDLKKISDKYQVRRSDSTIDIIYNYYPLCHLRKEKHWGWCLRFVLVDVFANLQGLKLLEDLIPLIKKFEVTENE